MCSEVICAQVAARHGLCHLNPKSMSLAEILRSHMEEPATLFTERCAAPDTPASAHERLAHCCMLQVCSKTAVEGALSQGEC